MKKKITTAKIQSSSTNVYLNIPKLVREMFDMKKGDEVEIFIDTATEEVTFKKKK